MRNRVLQNRSLSSAMMSLVCTVLIILAGSFITARGQDERRPERGFHPGNSYALSDIETISLSSGNLMLNVPLAALPAGRGGHGGFGVSLTYNAKLYDNHDEEVESPTSRLLENRRHLKMSEDGGWRYTLPVGFTMRVLSRNNEEPRVPCLPEEDGNYPKNAYIWKLLMSYPDGSTHEFRPAGNVDIFSDGFFNISPNGWRYGTRMFIEFIDPPPGGSNRVASCTEDQTLEITGPMVYYSTDGSYTKLVVEHKNDPNDKIGGGNPWTLFFADGSRVSGNRPDEPQRLRDRNNNYIELQFLKQNGHDAMKILDQLGRFVTIEMDIQFNGQTGRTTRQDYVTMTGFGGQALQWTIHWKEVVAVKQYKATVETGTRGRGNSYLTPWSAAFLVVDQITLPAQAGGLTYNFGYNVPDCVGACEDQTTVTNGWGEVSSVTLPSGARATYNYLLDGVSAQTRDDLFPTWKHVMNNRPVQKQLVYRSEHDLESVISSTPCTQNEACVTDTWVYGPVGLLATQNRFINTITGPDGGVYQEFSVTDPNSPFAGRTLRSIGADGTKVENIWRENKAPGMTGQSVNPFIKTIFTSVKNAAGNYIKTGIKDYSYDKNGNVTSVSEYDWVPYGDVPRDTLDNPTGVFTSIPGLSLKRVTTNTYHAATPDALDTTTSDPDIYYQSSAPRLRNAVASTEVAGASTLSRRDFTYDNALTTGNLTQQRMWDSTLGSLTRPLLATNSIAMSHVYDVYGNETLMTDARGVQTEYVYGPVGPVSDLYVTQTRTALGTAVQRTMQQSYDFASGLPTSTTDADNNVTTNTSYDALGRPTLVEEAVGTTVARQTATEYSDNERRVIMRSDLNSLGDGALVTVKHYDQLGRLRLTRQLEDVATESATDERSGIKVQTRYVNASPGSFVLTSNPYRADTSGEAMSETTMGWTRSRSDAGGRVVEVRSFSGATLPAPWGTNASTTGAVTTLYDGDNTTVTDQAGKVRRSLVDALGRLVRVDEPSDASNNLGPVTAPTQPTSYTYDALNNLIQVNQGAQVRTFSYSSFSRLVSANNPESGAINYQYDGNGNLKRKTDLRNVQTDYLYDELNRMRSRSYSDGTPPVSYDYDATSVAYSKGRLTRMSSTVSACDYLEYDALGRVKQSRQTTGQEYSMSYSYDLDGNLLSETYPSGRIVTTSYDSAGRAAGVSGQKTGEQNKNYASQVSYAAQGGIAALKLGNNLWEHTLFNSRLQPTEIGLGLNSSDSSKLKLNYGYGATDNNGNVSSQTITIGATTLNQTYTYDELNRLGSATEGSNWSQNYGYDRYGNRWVMSTSTYIPNPSLTPRQQSDFSVTNNRLVAAGFGYDLAGNLKSDPVAGTNAMSYDAENRLTSYKSPGDPSITTTYSYDGYGRRVLRDNGTVKSVFVYDVSGQLVAEYSNGPRDSGQKYLTTDHLGSTRVVTDANQAVKARNDYLPFGEEIGTEKGNRNSIVGYSNVDSTRQKFTQKERDFESGLDYFLARYYSSAQGRFTSADFFDGSSTTLPKDFAYSRSVPYATLLNPQTLNLYAYVENNPLSRVDRDGHNSGYRYKLPKNSRYEVMIHRNNENDNVNVHVFYKGQRQPLARVKLTEDGHFVWTGKLPESVKAQVEDFVKQKGITGRPLFGGRVTKRNQGGGEGEGGARLNNFLVVLNMIHVGLDAINQHSDTQNLGYHTDFAGKFIVDDVDKAGANLEPGTKVLVDDPLYFGSKPATFFVNEAGRFVTNDPRCQGCELRQDKEKIIVVSPT